MQQLASRPGRMKAQCSKGKGPRDSAARRAVQGSKSERINMYTLGPRCQTNVLETPRVLPPRSKLELRK